MDIKEAIKRLQEDGSTYVEYEEALSFAIRVLERLERDKLISLFPREIPKYKCEVIVDQLLTELTHE